MSEEVPAWFILADNPAYEGSAVLWFDEHNHPIKYDTLSPEERRTAHLDRCYKWVSLLHLRNGAFVYAGARMVPGNEHELPILYQMVETFVQRVGVVAQFALAAPVSESQYPFLRIDRRCKTGYA